MIVLAPNRKSRCRFESYLCSQKQKEIKLKLITNIIITFIIFTLAVMVFQIEITPINNSEFLSIAISSALFTVAAILLSVIIVIVLILLFMAVIAITEPSKNIMGTLTCSALIILLPLMIAVEAFVLVNGHQVAYFFPEFTWTQAIIVSVVTSLVGTTNTLSTELFAKSS